MNDGEKIQERKREKKVKEIQQLKGRVLHYRSY